MVNPVGHFRGEHETEGYFLHDYLPLMLANGENAMAERRAHLATIQRHFRLPQHPRLLDVGCALGFMLQVARGAGWEPVGVETSEFAARYAAEKTGCSVRTGTLQEAGFPSESFDVVTLMDVIEHVPDPDGLLREVRRVLRPEGVAYIVTPNFASFFVRLYGLNAYGIWPDQHVVYFQPSTIRRLLRRIGFRKVLTGTKDFYPENLRRFFGRKDARAAAEIKAAFGAGSLLGRLRRVVNPLLMHVPLGDKLIALAQG